MSLDDSEFVWPKMYPMDDHFLYFYTVPPVRMPVYI